MFPDNPFKALYSYKIIWFEKNVWIQLAILEECYFCFTFSNPNLLIAKVSTVLWDTLSLRKSTFARLVVQASI